MKHNYRKFLCVLLSCCIVIYLFSGCFYIVTGRSIAGNGNYSSREVQLDKDVAGVINQGSFDVLIDPSLTGKAVLEGDSNIIEIISVVQSGDGNVSVSLPNDLSVLHQGKITVRIPMLMGGFVHLNGSGRIEYTGDTPISAESFDVRVNGSGDMLLNIKGGKLKAGIAGSGDINVTGEVTDEEVTVTGSGNFDAFGLKANNVHAEIHGSGDVNITPEKELTGRIVGSGDITYDGNPERVDVSRIGSGDVTKR
jgi:hypothetical protein